MYNSIWYNILNHLRFVKFFLSIELFRILDNRPFIQYITQHQFSFTSQQLSSRHKITVESVENRDTAHQKRAKIHYLETPRTSVQNYEGIAGFSEGGNQVANSNPKEKPNKGGAWAVRNLRWIAKRNVIA